MAEQDAAFSALQRSAVLDAALAWARLHEYPLAVGARLRKETQVVKGCTAWLVDVLLEWDDPQDDCVITVMVWLDDEDELHVAGLSDFTDDEQENWLSSIDLEPH